MTTRIRQWEEEGAGLGSHVTGRSHSIGCGDGGSGGIGIVGSENGGNRGGSRGCRGYRRMATPSCAGPPPPGVSRSG